MSDKIKTEVIESVNSDGEVKETALQSTPMVVDAGKLEKIKEQLAGLKEMQAGPPLSPKYRTFEVGEGFRGIFLGFKTISTEKVDALEAAGWMEEDQNVYINAGANLVKQLQEHAIEPGTAISVELTGKEKTKAGHNVFIYDIRKLQAIG